MIYLDPLDGLFQAGLVSGAQIFGSFTPAAFADIIISGNGNGSTNSAPVVLTDITPATQTNSCTKNNTIKKKARTGRNKAKNNTNGNVDVLTGDVTQTGTTTNTCNTNTLTIN